MGNMFTKAFSYPLVAAVYGLLTAAGGGFTIGYVFAILLGPWGLLLSLPLSMAYGWWLGGFLHELHKDCRRLHPRERDRSRIGFR